MSVCHSWSIHGSTAASILPAQQQQTSKMQLQKQQQQQHSMYHNLIEVKERKMWAKWSKILTSTNIQCN